MDEVMTLTNRWSQPLTVAMIDSQPVYEVRPREEIFVTLQRFRPIIVRRHARAHEISTFCIQCYSSSLHDSVGPAARPKRREAAQRSRKARNRT
jgi:hypothetical protein